MKQPIAALALAATITLATTAPLYAAIVYDDEPATAAEFDEAATLMPLDKEDMRELERQNERALLDMENAVDDEQ